MDIQLIYILFYLLLRLLRLLRLLSLIIEDLISEIFHIEKIKAVNQSYNF